MGLLDHVPGCLGCHTSHYPYIFTLASFYSLFVYARIEDNEELRLGAAALDFRMGLLRYLNPRISEEVKRSIEFFVRMDLAA